MICFLIIVFADPAKSEALAKSDSPNQGRKDANGSQMSLSI